MLTNTHTERKLAIAEGSHIQSSNVRNTEMSWAELVEKLRAPVITDETVAEFAATTAKKQTEIKDVGYHVGGFFRNNTRKRENMRHRDTIALDADHAGLAYLDRIRSTVGGFAFALHSTHKHTPETPRFRLIFPLARSVTPEEYAPIARKLAEKIDIEYFDATTDEVGRAMFWPSCSRDGEYVFEVSEGAWVDPDAVLGEYNNWKDIATWPRSRRHPEERPHSGKKAKDPLKKGGHVGAFCRAHNIHDAILEFLGEYYIPADGERYTYAESTTTNGLVPYEDKWVYSHHESDPCSGRLCNAFDLVRIHLFGDQDVDVKPNTPVGKRPSDAAMRALVVDDGRAKIELIRERVSGFEETADLDWAGELKLGPKGRILATLHNSKVILLNDSNLQGIAFNEMREKVVKRRNLPWENCKDGRNGDPWQDIDDLQLRDYFEVRYAIELKPALVADAVRLAAGSHKFHPIKDYLNALTWDGAPRLDTMLHDHLGVARNAYTEAVSRKFMCAAVARVFDPGCKFDHCMILEGAQGIRKSTFLKTLAVDSDWFTDDIPHMSGKELIEKIQGAWIIELPELQALNKTTTDTLKACMSRTDDKARMAYGRYTQEFARQNVFAGTTNDADYLRDDTGNRRYWPVRCANRLVDLQKLEAIRDQLWAEAAKHWEGELLYLENADVEALAVQEQSARHVDDGMSGVIAEWLEQPVVPFEIEGPAVPREKVCARQIWVECLGAEQRDYTPMKGRPIGRAMDQIEGWSRAQNPLQCTGYGKQRAWTKNV